MIQVELKGLESVKAMFAEIGHQLSASQVRGIINDGGKVIEKQAKENVTLKGELGDLLKKDITVYRDRRKSMANAEFVLIGPKFRSYNIRNQIDQKVGVIAQHMTVGFQQTERTTKKGEKRGKVAEQEQNPVLSAYYQTKGMVQSGIEKGVNKQLKKVKSKFPEVVK
jgi:hypothetical protein